MEDVEEIRITFERWDRMWKLIVFAKANGYRGTGEGFFTPEELAAFAGSLSACPLPVEAPAVSGGSQWEKSSGDAETIGITVFPLGTRGQVAIQVRLATEMWDVVDAREQHVVRLIVRTTYQRLGTFAAELRSVVDGGLGGSELVLTGEML